ncbi:MAG: amidohydrolase family protein, partial [Gemmataceae bacterium]|nr:amidohydrolase family protein [Gemmataceae bacterium]MDW8266927.1 hypothetical protein [Gemmataceae bacterium]
MGASEFTWTARWVFPVVRPPLRNGTVTIAQGRIVAIEPYGRRRADRDLGEAALLPGLVNAHTHLDLAGLRSLGAAPAGHGDFTHWLRRVIAHRRERSAEQVLADIREGLDESLRHGTTLLGDIAAGGRSWDILARAPVRAVVFVEVLGLTAARAAQARAA